MLTWLESHGETIALLGIVVAISSQVWVQRRKLQWDRANLTASLVSQWDSRTEKHRQTIENMHGFSWSGPSIDLEGEEQEFANAKLDDYREHFEVKEAVIQLLNWFEGFAALYREEKLDRVMADNLMKAPVLRYYRRIQHLMAALNTYLFDHQPGWPILDELIKDWEAGRRPRRIRRRCIFCKRS